MKLLGYTPDIDPTIEGSIVTCTAFIPSDTGMESAPSAQDASINALASTCYGAVAVKKLDGSSRVFAGTSTKLYELSSTSWTDRTRTTGGNYTLGADDFWRFAQFGNATLAVNKSDVLQFSESGAFADVSGAPSASIVETCQNFVFLFNTDEVTYGDSPNRWWCSAVNDYTDWTPSIATQCATGILTSGYGRIYAARRLGDSIVAYKERSIYIANYVGAPQIWNWQQIRGDAGCNSQEAVVDIGTADNPIHLFMGADDFWRFDGAVPVPVGAPVRRTVYGELDFAFANKIKAIHDRVNSRVYFYYPAKGSSGVLNRCIVYHYRTDKWGRDDRTIQAGFELITGGYTYDTIPFSTYDSIPSSLSYDSPFWTSGQISPSFFDTSNKVNSLTGVATTSSFTTGDMGDDTNYYLLQRVKPVWLTKPTSATMTNSYKENEGDTLTEYTTSTMFDSRFDVLLSARWHRLRFNMVGDSLLNEVKIQYANDGLE